MKKKILIIVVILFLLISFIPIPFRLKDGGSIEFRALTYKITKVHKLGKNLDYEEGIIIEVFNKELYSTVSIKNNTVNEDESEIEKNMETTTNINVIIDGKKYNAKMENNETSQAFLNSLPQEFEMSELNGNEKYVYMNEPLPTNARSPKHIVTGDIMLYGNNCLVLFYKSFDTSYSYTKIGHIDHLPDLGNGNIIVTFEK